MENKDRKRKAWPTNIGEAVKTILSVLTAKSKDTIRNMDEAIFLVGYHFGLGFYIRDQFGLWDGNTDLLKACGSENMHPESAATIILEAVWEAIRKDGGKVDRDPMDAASNRLHMKEIDAVLSHLNPRERRVFQLRFGLEDGISLTLEEVGAEFGVSRETVLKIEMQALRKIRRLNKHVNQEQSDDQ